jgi:hypothetical protein
MGSLRVEEDGEYEGLDLAEHSESAYALGGTSLAEKPAGASGDGVLVGAPAYATIS